MEPLASSSPPNSQLSTSPSTPKSKVFIFTEYKEKEDGSDLISIQNFESFLSKVYRDVLFSYHSFLRFSEKPLNAISINFEGFKENKFSEFKNQINKGTITLEQINRSLSDISKKQVDEIRKKMEDEIKKDCSLPHFFNRIFIKDSDTNIGLLNSNQKFA
ncbi:hypothetical protein RB653_003477 [Dictyostelium firmibasis]|uniref:Uncharacterized protein n=1 Tax=Dictyostelium firmibasis TaxID=79012 RepID=A0AAN7TZA5_9MYCE